MAFYNSLNNLPELKNTVLTIGTFDGVHRGHQSLFEIMIERGKTTHSESVVITFDPHPQHVIYNGINPKKLITTVKDKVNYLTKLGINHILVIPFDKDFSRISASQFLNEIIIQHFRPKEIIVGHDHHFGFRKNGNIEFLMLQKIKYNFDVIKVDANYQGNKIISSSWIRRLIELKKIEKVNLLLGRNYSLTGIVINGAGRGNSLGFPTANINIQNPLLQLPQNGVYFVKVILKNIHYYGVCNVGTRPTFDTQKTKIIEVYMFLIKPRNFYGKELKVEFIQFIRDEKKFESKEKLIDQIKKDKMICQKIMDDQGMKKRR